MIDTVLLGAVVANALVLGVLFYIFVLFKSQ